MLAIYLYTVKGGNIDSFVFSLDTHGTVMFKAFKISPAAESVEWAFWIAVAFHPVN